MNILFVCKHNTFRSRIAEAYSKDFPSYWAGYNISSGGIFAPGGKLLDVQKKVIKKLGLKLSKKYTLYRQKYCGCEFSIKSML